jgi:hypothetical protein
MQTALSRRSLLIAGSQLAAAGAAIAAYQPGQGDPGAQPSRTSNGRPRPDIDPKNVPKKGPAIDRTLVFEFVYFAHTNIDVVRDMLADTPTLVNAAWDWGGGDWETALGAAGHMGRRDIAELMIESGARIELPAACMLGQLDLVKAAIAAFPRAARTPGPHGIPLIAHAKKGGAQAKDVLEYLEAISPAKDK